MHCQGQGAAECVRDPFGIKPRRQRPQLRLDGKHSIPTSHRLLRRGKHTSGTVDIPSVETDNILSQLLSTFRLMEKPEITAYLKTYCGWSAGVRAILQKHDLAYTEKDIIQNPAFRWEMEQKSGQPLSPCVEINGQMLPDVSGDDVERYLLENNLTGASNASVSVPTNAPCTDAQHAAMAAGQAPLEFKPNH